MKLSASRSTYNFYESFSDLLFCTLVLFVVLVLALALNVNKKVKDYKEKLRQEAPTSALDAARAEAADLRQRLQTAEKRLTEAEAGTTDWARAEAAIRMETQRADKAEAERGKALRWMQEEETARRQAEQRAGTAEKRAAAAERRAETAEENLRAVEKRLAAAQEQREQAEKRLAALQSGGLSNKKWSPGVLFYSVHRGDRVVIGGKSFTPEQLVAIIRSMEGQVIVSFMPNDDFLSCPSAFYRRYLEDLLSDADTADIDMDSLRRRNRSKW